MQPYLGNTSKNIPNMACHVLLSILGPEEKTIFEKWPFYLYHGNNVIMSESKFLIKKYNKGTDKQAKYWQKNGNPNHMTTSDSSLSTTTIFKYSFKKSRAGLFWAKYFL